MKTALTIVGGLAVLLIMGMVALFMVMGGPQELSLRRRFDALVKTNDHEAVARAAIAVIQVNTNSTAIRGNRLTALPLPIASMNPKSVAVSPNGMTIEFHGGFDHYGFQIRGEDRLWKMTWYTEQGQHSLLQIAKDARDGEPDGAANGTQPIRLATNGTASAAASRR